MTPRRNSKGLQPFIVTGDDTAAHEHRLLLITPHFPPNAGSGSLRWQKLSRYIAARGWGLDVIMLDPAEIEFSDAAPVKELPPGIQVFGVRSERPRLERFIRRVWQLWGRSPAPTTDLPLASAATQPRVERPSPGVRPESLRRSDIRWFARSPRDLVRAFTSWVYFAQWMN